MRLTFFFLLLLTATNWSCTPSQEEMAPDDSIYSTSSALQNYLIQISRVVSAPKNGLYTDGEVMDDFSNVTTLEEFFTVCEKHLEDPVLVREALLASVAYARSFQQEFPEFALLTPEHRKKILRDALLVSETTAGYQDMALGNISNCKRQYNTDLQSCAYTAYIEAAFCGLLSPTLIGAVGCAALVVAQDMLCHSTADKTYRNCLIAEAQ